MAEKVKAARKIAWINADIVRDNYSEAFNLRFYHLYNKVVTASARLRDLLLDAWHFRPEQLLPYATLSPPHCCAVLPAVMTARPDSTPAHCACSQWGGSPPSKAMTCS